MTPSEFKAWFDGFTEAFTGCPTKAQWTRIKTRVAEIDGKSVTYPVYVDRYLPSYPSYPYWRYANGIGVLSNTATLCAGQNAISSNTGAQIGGTVAFNSMQAMTDLGRAEAASIDG